MQKKTRKIYRDSDTGQFTTKKKVQDDPKKTETERRPAPKRKKKS